MQHFVGMKHADSNVIERLFFEYNAGKDIIAFLMKDKNVRRDLLQEYIDVVETRCVELELTKKALSEEYAPENFCYSGYTFDFDNQLIVFTGCEQ